MSIDLLRMVAAAAAEGAAVPLLDHIAFAGGRVQAGNGRVNIDAPSPWGNELDGVCVAAATFLDALDCRAPVLTRAGLKLEIRSGKTHTELTASAGAAYPWAAAPTGGWVGTIDREPLRRLQPFVGADALASRVWGTTVLVREGHGYATNNVVMARTPIDYHGTELAVPLHCLSMMLSLPAAGFEIWQDPAITTCIWLRFGECWTRSVLLATAWPDVNKYFESWPEVPPCDTAALLDAVNHIEKRARRQHEPFIRIDEGTLLFEGAQVGKTKTTDLCGRGRWHIDVLQLVLKHADAVDWATFPVCKWQGPQLQGIMAGAGG